MKINNPTYASKMDDTHDIPWNRLAGLLVGVLLRVKAIVSVCQTHLKVYLTLHLNHFLVIQEICLVMENAPNTIIAIGFRKLGPKYG